MHWQNFAHAFRIRFRQICSGPFPPYLGGNGRGLVTCAGGWRFLAGIYTIARVLRHVGSTLPIEAWYLGDAGEYDPCFAAVTKGLDVRWIDAQEHARRNGISVRRWGGWESKSYAAAHSSFAEVLFLDADCYPERDPAYLFDEPGYLDKGAIFWPDIGRTKNGSPLEPGQWERFGLPVVSVPSLESGQFLVDRRRCWRELCAVRWISDHSDYVYQHVYGDKDTFSIAWRGIQHFGERR